MSRNRLPLAKAAVSGASLKNPQRYRASIAAPGRPPLGEPFPQMTPAQQEAWRDMATVMPWLSATHRHLLRLACIITARLDDPNIGVNQMQTLSAILSKLGATPVDEGKTLVPADDQDDPAARFFGPH